MIRVFVGNAPNGEDAESCAVLEYTLRKHASQPVEITWMRLGRGEPWTGWQTQDWATPFSGFRWAVPEVCKFEGRAIYMDSDMIVRADIAQLWDTRIEPGRVVVAKGGDESWRYCVALWDCAEARKHVPAISAMRSNPGSHRNMVSYFRGRASYIVQAFPKDEDWNCIDGQDYFDLNDGRIKIFHYSSEAHQPQLKHAIPRLARNGEKHWFDGQVKLHWRPEVQTWFDRLLEEAIDAGFRVEDYVPNSRIEYTKKSMKGYRSNKWGRLNGN